jgi:AcrR family transcriptional regulator
VTSTSSAPPASDEHPAEARRPRYTKGARTKQRIVDAALELFASSGFHGVSVRDIAAHVGLSHVAVLQHFDGGKDELLIQVLRRRDEREADRQATERASAGDVVGFVRRLLGREVAQPELVSLYVKMASESTSPDHPAHDYFVERYHQVRASAAAGFRAYLEQHPEVPPFDVELVAQQSIALIDGIQVQWLHEPDRIDMAEVIVAWLATLGIREE